MRLNQYKRTQYISLRANVLQLFFCSTGLCFGLFVYSQLRIKKSLKLSQLFSDHMVLQQKEKVNFWGQAAPGEKVIVSAGWNKQALTIADIKGK